MAIIDDNYIIGPKEDIFWAWDDFAADLTEVGLKLQPGMSTCYIANQFRTAEWDGPRGGIPNRSITDADQNEDLVLAVHNVPVGSVAFVKAYLAKRGTTSCRPAGLCHD